LRQIKFVANGKNNEKERSPSKSKGKSASQNAGMPNGNSGRGVVFLNLKPKWKACAQGDDGGLGATAAERTTACCEISKIHMYERIPTSSTKCLGDGKRSRHRVSKGHGFVMGEHTGNLNIVLEERSVQGSYGGGIDRGSKEVFANRGDRGTGSLRFSVRGTSCPLTITRKATYKAYTEKEACDEKRQGHKDKVKLSQKQKRTSRLEFIKSHDFILNPGTILRHQDIEKRHNKDLPKIGNQLRTGIKKVKARLHIR